MSKTHTFEVPSRHKSIIKVIGVGGGGGNAVNFMYNQGIKDVSFVVCNTDVQALDRSPVPNKLQIGVNLMDGLGAGAKPERGSEAALESEEAIREMLMSDNTKMLFITAGMGGGTGTGAAPVIARIAKECGLLTVGIVTSPFAFEGPTKRRNADKGIAEMKKFCDTVLVILNDKIREMFGDLAINQAYAQADTILSTAAKSISEVITCPLDINIDFEDVKTVMKESGTAVLGSAEASGENRAIRATEAALSSPLLNNRDIRGAKKVLFSVVGGDSPIMTMDEFGFISEYIQSRTGEADFIFGTTTDPSLGAAIRVTVVATGFEDENAPDKGELVPLSSGNAISLPITPTPPKPVVEEKKTLETTTIDFKEDVNIHTPSQPNGTENNNVNNISSDEQISVTTSAKPEAPVVKQPESLESIDPKEHYRRLAEARRKEILSGATNATTKAWEGSGRKDLEKPAFVRNQTNIQETQPSNSSQVSRTLLNGAGEITSTNKFLGDNVD